MHTDNFVQITGRLEQTRINIKKGDSGGEMDAHGEDDKSNPIGALVLGAAKDGSLIQFPEWTSFMGSDMVSSGGKRAPLRTELNIGLYLHLYSSVFEHVGLHKLSSISS